MPKKKPYFQVLQALLASRGIIVKITELPPTGFAIHFIMMPLKEKKEGVNGK